MEQRVGRKKLLPLLSLLLGIWVIGFVLPGRERLISKSLGGTVVTKDQRRPQSSHDSKKHSHSGQIAATVQVLPQAELQAFPKPATTTVSASRQVQPKKQVDDEVSAVDQYRSGEAASAAADIPTAAPAPRERVDKQQVDRKRVASRLPISQAPMILPKAGVVPQPVFVAQWPLAESLIAQLSDLQSDDAGGNLATLCLEQLWRLHKTESLDSPACADVFDQLKWLEDNARQLAANAITRESAAALHRVAYAIQRRLEIWRQIHTIAKQNHQVSAFNPATQDWKSILAALENELHSLKESEAWRTYLMVNELQQVFTGHEASAGDRRQLAQRVLRRMSSSQLTPAQQKFFEREGFQQFQGELAVWASEPVDYAAIMRQLEQYESGDSALRADRVVAAQRALLLSPNDEAKELARLFDVHYRNANLRIAVSGDLINRLLPQEQQTRESVNDYLLGADVRGVSEATSRTRVRLLPDRHRWRVGIESRNEGVSQTEAARGPVVFENYGRFRVNVRKFLLIDRRGVLTTDAEAEAESDQAVTGLSTDFDSVPLLNGIVRSIAMNQQANTARDAEWEVNRKLEALASRRMDEEVHRRLEQAEQLFKSEWVEPIRRLGLDPKPIQMQSTDKRLIARYRLAADTQLAAFTPRPMALSDSWLSMQIHESTLNNVVRQLELEGQSLEVPELYRKIGEKLGRSGAVPEDLPEGVTIQFADNDAVRLACDDDRIQVTLRIAKLSAGQKRWHGFVVQVNYVVSADGLDVRVMRDASPDDYIAVQGVRRLGNRIAIATIFAKVFDNSRQFPLLPQKMASDERLKDLSVQQLVVNDGWIGLSLAPIDAVRVVGQDKPRATSR